MKKTNLPFTLKLACLAIGLLAAKNAEATLFDPANVLEPGKFSVGVVGELLLSNPTSEGAEARVKYGVSSNFSSQAIIGLGSGSRKFRLGVHNTLSIFPDAEGQLGVALLLGGLYLNRERSKVFIAHAGPMIHESFDTAWPIDGFFAIPFIIELDSGRYTTGAQLVAGIQAKPGVFFITGELGLGMGRMESYVATGVGINF